MANEKRLIEIPSDGIVRIPIMSGADTVGEKAIDLSHIPTVDAVEVVRCKDCKHRIYSEFDGCHVCHHGGFNAMNEEHFCSYGEKMGDGNG